MAVLCQQRDGVIDVSRGAPDEIGEKLFLSPRTIESHLYRILPKLGVTTRSQLRDVIPESMPA